MCAQLCPWCALNPRKFRNSSLFRNYKFWNNRKPQQRLEICSQGCLERQQKIFINHTVCSLYFLSFSQGSFQPPPHFMIPVLLSWVMVVEADSTFGHICPRVACPSHSTHALVVDDAYLWESVGDLFTNTRCVLCLLWAEMLLCQPTLVDLLL